jgi:hypothetical protein
MQYRTRGTYGVVEPEGALATVPRTNWGGDIFERCSLNSDFHGAWGSTDAVGAVVDMVCRRRVRRPAMVLEAIVADLGAVSMRVVLVEDLRFMVALELWKSKEVMSSCNSNSG